MGRLVRLLLEREKGFGSTIVAIALFLSVSALVGLLCAKRARPRTNTLASPMTKKKNSNKAIHNDPYKEIHDDDDHGYVISTQEMEMELERSSSSSGGGGGGGLWQKSIMMGDKCRPPEFSGVIYYDSHGNQLPEMPRSPRATPLQSFSFPVLS